MERIEDLLIDGLKIYQDDALYKFTSDAVLLSKFATVKKGDTVADFCSGSGIVGFHLFALHKFVKSVTFFEMQKPLFDLSLKSIELNGLSVNFSAVNVKLQDIGKEYYGKFSLIVCNPPYMERGRGEEDADEFINVCRREVALTLSELLSAAGKCLKFGGRFALVHRADRAADVLCGMRENGIEPKKLAFVSGGDKEPYLMLAEGIKGGRRGGLKVLKQIKNGD